MSIGGVIFDLDGTLIDSLDDLAESVNAVLVSHGLPPHPRDAYRGFVGEGMGELVRRALGAGAEATLLEECVANVRREYGMRWDRKTRAYPAIVDTLAVLRERGLELAILSNKPHDLVVRIAERFFAAGTFRSLLGAEHGFARKPDPSGAIATAARLGIAADRCAYVGDSATDMLTAQAAKMVPVGVLWGFRSAAELTAAGAHSLVQTPDAIVALVASFD